jgi:murein DD-endopeptidase MepM/ murein hydrolase activator NlpD
MPHLFERTALILLASTALSAAPSLAAAQAPLLDLPSAAASAGDPSVALDAASRARRGPAATYTVRKGDTLAEIAAKLGTEIDDLARLNGLKKPYRLQPGQVLKNPKAPKAAKASPSSARSSRGGDEGGGGTYTVKRGDTLFSIAQRNGTTVEALRAANGMGRNTSLIPGRKLALPGRGGGSNERAASPNDDTELADRMAEAARRDEARAGSPGRTATGREVTGREVTGREVTGRVVTIDVPGRAYSVKKGDTLERVADRLDSSVAELARLNKLKKPYRLRPGQTVRGPGTSARAYVVGRGDTISEIARRFSVSEAELRSANGLRRGASVAPGRRLRLPNGYRDRGPLTTTAPVRQPEAPPVATAPAPSTPAPTPYVPPRAAPPRPEPGLPSQPQPYRPSPGASPGTTPYPRTGPVAGAPVASPPVSDAQIMEMGRGLFVWPLQGPVISGFGGRGSGPRNDGLNIRANAGEPVRAAAAGDVVYAGDQVPGFGNLVLVKHADGWVTAYGHLGKVDVRMQQKVSQGQQIGQVGTTGGVSEPQLHFEVRYAPTPQERARPIDPALVLPR